MQSWLMHHGVKGMKWGVRRTDAELGNETPSEKGNRIGKKLAATGLLGAIGSARKNR